MGTERLLKYAFIADRRLKPEVPWRLLLEHQLQGLLIPSPTEEQPNRRQFSLVSAQSQHIQQLSLETSPKSMTYHQIKLDYACEPYIQQTNNSHLRKIIAQFRTGSHWLHIETGRYKKLAKQDRTCPMCFFKLTNPGIAPAGMPLIQMMRAVAILKMSTMPFSIVQDIHMPESYFRTFSRVIPHLSASFSTSHNATGWPKSLLGSE